MAQGRSTEIITMIKWIRTSRLSIKNSLSGSHHTLQTVEREREREREKARERARERERERERKQESERERQTDREGQRAYAPRTRCPSD